jgi:putative ABC transport system permease protein
VVVALFGTTLGLALGTAAAWVLVRSAGGSDPIAITIPGARLAVVLAVGALAGVLAALLPARRAARLPVLEAIRT